MSWDKLPQLNVLVKGKWSLILKFLSIRVGGSTALDTFFQMAIQMDDNAKAELLKRLMAHDVMGGGRQFLSTALLLYLDPEELKNCRQVSSSSRMSVMVCVSIDFIFNTINVWVGQQGVGQVHQGDVEEPGHL